MGLILGLGRLDLGLGLDNLSRKKLIEKLDKTKLSVINKVLFRLYNILLSSTHLNMHENKDMRSENVSPSCSLDIPMF